MTNGWMIETSSVCRIFQIGASQVAALRGVDLLVKKKEFLALKGRSGSGKTTLLNCLGGLDRPTSGSVRVAGQALAEMNESQLTHWRRTQVGLVFQSFGLLPTLSAYENIELVMRIAGHPYPKRRTRTHRCLELVGLAGQANHRPYELSGGQQQRVAIARALANQPALILADEPTAELDSATSREILALFRNLVDQEGLTILVTSHDPLVEDFVDRTLTLQDGQIVR